MRIRSFFLNLAVFSIPLILSIFMYLWMDPFKVIGHYDSYYDSNEPNYISLNKDFVSTRNWINHYP
ncbi:hypothetical protein ACX0G7_26520, partial [Flavitalea antarctica]